MMRFKSKAIIVLVHEHLRLYGIEYGIEYGIQLHSRLHRLIQQQTCVTSS